MVFRIELLHITGICEEHAESKMILIPGEEEITLTHECNKAALFVWEEKSGRGKRGEQEH
jgi:hypothetical protein